MSASYLPREPLVHSPPRKALSPSQHLNVQNVLAAANEAKAKMGVVYANRLPSVTIRPTNNEMVVPVLVCNTDPATINIPIMGKVLSTWCLVVLWTGIMLMTCIVSGFEIAPMQENPMFGPSARHLIEAGAIHPTKLDDGEYWRLLWATQMHAGWVHMALNIMNYIPLGYIIEPDWGTTKMLFVFICSAWTGSLASVAGGRATAVGASGGIFGIMAALVIYILEYWSTIPRARIILPTVFAVLAISIGMSFVPYVDKWAHIGGFVGGLLASTVVIRDLPEWFRNRLACKCSKKSYEKIALTPNTPASKVIHTNSNPSADDEDPTTGSSIEEGDAPQYLGGIRDLTDRDVVRRAPIVVKHASPSHDGQPILAKLAPSPVKMYKVSSRDVYADVPPMAHPALVKIVNKRANRWIGLRKVKRNVDPQSWVTSQDTYEYKSVLIWTIRIFALLSMIGLWLGLIEMRFGLIEFFTPRIGETASTEGTITVKSLLSSPLRRLLARSAFSEVFMQRL